MSIEFLEDLEQEIDRGRVHFICRGATISEWFISTKIEDLRERAQRTARTTKMPNHIFRIINRSDVTTGDSYLVVRKFLEPSRSGEPRMQWALVDTREAAEVMRDVSQGPSPYFGAVTEETFNPE
jgi:hypothetical protein